MTLNRQKEALLVFSHVFLTPSGPIVKTHSRLAVSMLLKPVAFALNLQLLSYINAWMHWATLGANSMNWNSTIPLSLCCL